MEFFTQTEDETRALGAALGTLAQAGDVVLLQGDLGAGKTRFAQGVARGLGVERPVTSPTFALVEVYEGRLPLYHFDLYRLETPDDLESIDFFALVEGDGLALVEWPQRFADAMPDDALTVELSSGEALEERRRLAATASGPRSQALLQAWETAVAA